MSAAHPGRFILGIGAGHPERSGGYSRPYDRLVEFLDVFDSSNVPADHRMLAALGPRVLALAAQRAAGALPYLTTPEHTRRAREILGADRLLAPEQKIVLETDPDTARAMARRAIELYLNLTNYTANLRRRGRCRPRGDSGAEPGCRPDGRAPPARARADRCLGRSRRSPRHRARTRRSP